LATEHTKCLICGSANLKPKWFVNGFHIVQCQDCTLAFVKENLTGEELSAWYEKVEEDYIYNDPGNVENLKYYFRKLRGILEGLVPSGKILDVGCSGGYFLDVMEGWDRYGVEFSPTYAEIARAKHGNRIHTGTLLDFPSPNAFFDVITIQDAYDHFGNPREGLERCHALLKPGGLLVVKVHDISSLYARVHGSKYYGVIPPYHLLYFGKKSLRTAMERAGFQVLMRTYIAHILFLKTIPYRLSRARGRGFFHWLWTRLNGTWLGNLRIRKNVYDIVTMVARKK
jgi:SAM-dependent methyltransferase